MLCAPVVLRNAPQADEKRKRAGDIIGGELGRLAGEDGGHRLRLLNAAQPQFDQKRVHGCEGVGEALRGDAQGDDDDGCADQGEAGEARG